MKHYFSVGDRVNKKTGYKFPGVVRSSFNTSKGEVRYVVELDELGLLHIFNGEQLECGELLEGGTVEKNESHDKPCCRNSGACGCFCHNKKEGVTRLWKFDGTPINRKTPKELPCKNKPCVHDIAENVPKEEVKLPEPFEYDFNKYGLTRHVTEKLNEILDYLRSKEL